ncbi:gamma-glutamyltransferase [Mangrovicoccus algicola]|uniref:Gamma-glutamyltransferase n=1 Tax=Mangrovicoccus algicola TaxID=2771008 RepID=A0A8J7CWM3_9RHOB|nr:gamma-glutamyltransferase [Mangrovicoccus algicola]MBE3637947.1 gamma-glutamyltransferase [Mangrovicoccus algicola]
MAGSFSRSQITLKPGAVAVEGGVVAAQHVLAAEAGAAVLAAGGDAVDAAVATSFVLGVLEPWMSGPMGGGAMMLWREDEGRGHALSYGMRASQSLDVAHYPLSGAGKASDLFPWESVVEDRNIAGGSSVAVPGTVAGIAAAHERFGRMPWAELLAPAIDHAKRGMEIDWYAALVIASSAQDLSRDPDAAAMFLDDGQWPKSFGWTALADRRIDQSGMAATLDRLASAGARDFYEGDIAAALVADVTAKGGFLTAADMAGYAPEWSDPLDFPYRDGRILAVPGLTAGPTLADAMGAWQAEYAAADAAAPAAHVARTGAIRAAYARRLAEMGDHDSARAPGCTTHFSVVDRAGNMVSMTQTLLSVFGSRTVSPATGLLLNNGIMWFDPEQGKPNSLGAGKRCLMNVCPVIGEGAGRRFALGAAGGRKIMPAVAQIAAQLVETGATLQEAMEAPRLDASGGDPVVADERLAGPVTGALSARWPVATAKRLPFPFAFAAPAAVLREAGRNSGTTETLSPWGDAIAEGDTA